MLQINCSIIETLLKQVFQTPLMENPLRSLYLIFAALKTENLSSIGILRTALH